MIKPLILPIILSLSACTTLSTENFTEDVPSVRVVGLSALPSDGLELRFALKLRVQNPNEDALAFDGLSVSLDLDERGVASGVSNEAGKIERFSETVLSVPVSISAFAALRELLARANDSPEDNGEQSNLIRYSLKGKLGAAGSSIRATRFSDSGEFSLFSSQQ